MFEKQHHLRIKFEVHAITCPGVWLCPNGDIDLSITTLGYNFHGQSKIPRFPLCYHETFIMQGYFKSLYNLLDLENLLGNEHIEVALWQSGRRLSHYSGKFSQLMKQQQSTTHITNNLNNNNNNNNNNNAEIIEILMQPSSYFPGIIGPKIQLTYNVQFNEICKDCNAYIKNINIPFDKLFCFDDQPAKLHVHKEPGAFKRQKPVCHTTQRKFIDQRNFNKHSNLFQKLIELNNNGAAADVDDDKEHFCSFGNYSKGSVSAKNSNISKESNKFMVVDQNCSHHQSNNVINNKHNQKTNNYYLKSCNVCQNYRSYFNLSIDDKSCLL